MGVGAVDTRLGFPTFAGGTAVPPARAALFASVYPQRNGVLGFTHNPFNWDLGDPSFHPASKLRGDGYRTHPIGVHHGALVLDNSEVAERPGFDE